MCEAAVIEWMVAWVSAAIGFALGVAFVAMVGVRDIGKRRKDGGAA